MGPFRTSQESLERQTVTLTPHFIDHHEIGLDVNEAYDIDVAPTPSTRSALSIESTPGGVRFRWKAQQTGAVVLRAVGLHDFKTFHDSTDDRFIAWREIDEMAHRANFTERYVRSLELQVEVDNPDTEAGGALEQLYLIDRQFEILRVSRPKPDYLQYQAMPTATNVRFDIWQFRGPNLSLFRRQEPAYAIPYGLDIGPVDGHPILVICWSPESEEGRAKIVFGTYIDPSGEQLPLDATMIRKVHTELARYVPSGLWAWWPFVFRKHIIRLIHYATDQVGPHWTNQLIAETYLSDAAKLRVLWRHRVLNELNHRWGSTLFTSQGYGQLATGEIKELAGRAPNSQEFQRGARLGAYKIVRRVGDGGTSIVYKGRIEDSADDRPDEVAIKVLKTEHRTKRTFKRLWNREAELMQRLPPHPHLVQLIEALEDPLSGIRDAMDRG